jgi:hypothetical protein
MISILDMVGGFNQKSKKYCPFIASNYGTSLESTYGFFPSLR